MSKYTIGVDFGTLSVRSTIVDVCDGTELASAECNYSHQIIQEHLPVGTEIPKGWALQDADDYLEGLKATISCVLSDSKIDKKDIIGIGIDFTCNTILPIDQDGKPLYKNPKWEADPHAWIKLWKHNTTQQYSRIIENVAIKRNENFLKHYGKKVSPSWMFPRLLETCKEDPELFYAANKFIEAGDWIVLQLTGKEKRSASMAGYKAFWSKTEGYPTQDFFFTVDKDFKNIVDEKLRRDLYVIGSKAGDLNSKGAEITGLCEGTAVTVANIDAHAAVPASGLTEPGDMLLVLGTSGCHLVLSDKEREVPGICGVVKDGMIPGLYGYEAGQNSVGDCLSWFAQNCIPEDYMINAGKKGLNIFDYLNELAAKMEPGENGLIALDWWNGNRSVLCDYDLSGVILGLTIRTRCEEIYRALIESIAFGTRCIIETFEQNDIQINNIIACGGVAKKNSLFMQIFADVLNKKIKIAQSDQASAFGSAILAAVAAGSAKGGYDDVKEAVTNMAGDNTKEYKPNINHHMVYDELYFEYLKLQDYFGKGTNNVLRKLKNYRK